jgi:hypothetical protein
LGRRLREKPESKNLLDAGSSEKETVYNAFF